MAGEWGKDRAPDLRERDGDTMKLWGARMRAPLNPLVEKLNASLPIDIRLFREDIDGSLAWTHGLQRAGILSTDEARRIRDGLEKVRAEFVTGSFAVLASDEDNHTPVERRLTAPSGGVGGQPHTGQ